MLTYDQYCLENQKEELVKDVTHRLLERVKVEKVTESQLLDCFDQNRDEKDMSYGEMVLRMLEMSTKAEIARLLGIIEDLGNQRVTEQGCKVDYPSPLTD